MSQPLVTKRSFFMFFMMCVIRFMICFYDVYIMCFMMCVIPSVYNVFLFFMMCIWCVLVSGVEVYWKQAKGVLSRSRRSQIQISPPIYEIWNHTILMFLISRRYHIKNITKRIINHMNETHHMHHKSHHKHHKSHHKYQKQI